MENPSDADEKPDCPETRRKSQRSGFRSVKMDHAYDEQQLQMSNKVEQRRSIHSVNTAFPKDDPIVNSQYEQLYPHLKGDAFVHATRSSGSTPSVEQTVSSERPNLLTSNKLAILVVVVAVILGLGIFLCYHSWNVLSPDKQITTKEETGKDTPLERLRERFRSLHLLFSGQVQRLWTVSKAAIRPLLDIPKHPAVILLAGSKQTTATTDCIALKMSEAVKDAFETEAPVAVFDCRKYKDWEPQAVKREMDKQLTEAFENGAKVGVVLAVESLPGTSPMIFYRFCDTANAPFKDVVLILTLNMEKEATSDRDSEAHEELGRLWHSVLDPEQVDPLFSRIGNSVAYVSKENDLSHC